MNFHTRYNTDNDITCELCKVPVIPKNVYMVMSYNQDNCYAEIYMHITCYAHATQDKQRYENLKKRMDQLCRG